MGLACVPAVHTRPCDTTPEATARTVSQLYITSPTSFCNLFVNLLWCLPRYFVAGHTHGLAQRVVNVPVAMALSSRMHAYAHTYTLDMCHSTQCLSQIRFILRALRTR